MAVMRNSIIFGGINSADYGIYIGGEGTFNAPARQVEMVEVPGRNGAIAVDQGRWENITVTYSAFNYEENLETFAQQLSDFRNAICSQIGYQRLTDTFHPDEYRMAICLDPLEIKPIDYNTASQFEIKFNCKPQRWLTEGEEPVTIGEWGATKTVSGEIVTIESEGGEAAKSLEVSLSPIQAGSGEPSPSNVRPISGRTEVVTHRMGKNAIGEIIDGEGYNARGETETNAKRFRTNRIKCQGESNVTVSWSINEISTQAIRCIWDENGNLLNRTIPSATTIDDRRYYVTDLSLFPNASYIAFAWYADGNKSAQGNATNMMVEFTNNLSDYEPYQGTTYTTALGRTVYGGTLDVVSGELVVTDGYIASYNGETLPSTWISDRDVYASGTTPTAGAQVAYKLATPQTYQLTPQQIGLLLGENNLWSDGEITMQYGMNPNSLWNPTLYDAGPLLMVEGYGNIDLGENQRVQVQNMTLGEITYIEPTSSTAWNFEVSTNPNDGRILSGDALNIGKLTTVITMSLDSDAPYTFVSSGTGATFTKNELNASETHSVSSYKATVAINVPPQTMTFTSSVGATTVIQFTLATTSAPITMTWTFIEQLYGTTTFSVIANCPRPQSGITTTFSHSFGGLTAESSISTLGHPTYIDLEIGEAYKYEDDVLVSVNNGVSLPASLPVLKPGETEITTDDTITALTIIPRWWQL